MNATQTSATIEQVLQQQLPWAAGTVSMHRDTLACPNANALKKFCDADLTVNRKTELAIIQPSGLIGWDCWCRAFTSGNKKYFVVSWKEEGDNDFAKMCASLRNPDGNLNWTYSDKNPDDEMAFGGWPLKNTHTRVAWWEKDA